MTNLEKQQLTFEVSLQKRQSGQWEKADLCSVLWPKVKSRRYKLHVGWELEGKSQPHLHHILVGTGRNNLPLLRCAVSLPVVYWVLEWFLGAFLWSGNSELGSIAPVEMALWYWVEKEVLDQPCSDRSKPLSWLKQYDYKSIALENFNAIL